MNKVDIKRLEKRFFDLFFIKCHSYIAKPKTKFILRDGIHPKEIFYWFVSLSRSNNKNLFKKFEKLILGDQYTKVKRQECLQKKRK